MKFHVKCEQITEPSRTEQKSIGEAELKVAKTPIHGVYLQ